MNLQLWKIEESVSFFEEHIGSLSGEAKEELKAIHHDTRRLEWLSARWLLTNILNEYNVDIERLVKDEFGKPHLQDSPLHISISHAFPYVAAIVDIKEPTGVDIDIPREKVLKIAPRFLHEEEQQFCGEDVKKIMLCWSAKETLYKIFGRRKLAFKEQLRLKPFSIGETVHITGSIFPDEGNPQYCQLHGHVWDDLVMVYKK